MLCAKPFMAGSIPFGCGQCEHCRLKRARLWSWRQYFESLGYEHNCFVTLTYDDEHLPRDNMLEPKVVQMWLKRMRSYIAPHKFRYFLVGEYGGQSNRPHYHLSMFGVSQFSSFGNKSFPDLVRESWGRGFVYVAEFNERTAHYVTGYVVKSIKDKERGQVFQVPEFARFSLRPGLGFFAMRTVAGQLLRADKSALRDRDVPNQLSFGRRKVVLGRYLLNALRNEVGFAEDYSKKFRDNLTYEKSLEMCSLLDSKENLKTFKEAYLDATRQARLSQVARSKIFRKVNVL